MNTSDQNLYPMDTAFKRRWEWESCSVEEEYEILLKKYSSNTPVLEFKEKKYEWIALLKKLNRRITGGRQGMEDKQIGPWFIKPAGDGTVCVESFANKLLFYLWCDVFKDDQDSENCPFITHCEKGNEINTFGMLQSLFQNKGLEAIFKPEILKGCRVQSSDVGASGEDAQTSDENLPERTSTDESEEVAEQAYDPMWVDQRDAARAVDLLLQKREGLDLRRLRSFDIFHLQSVSDRARFSSERICNALEFQPHYSFEDRI